MALFDKILKRGKFPQKVAPEIKEKGAVREAKAKSDVKGGNFAVGMGVIHSVHVTEKAADLGHKRQYVFRVGEHANKIMIKNAVAKRYGVRVLYVRTLRIPGKTRRLGRRTGWVPGYAKAVVTLQEGDAIEIT